MSIAPVPTVLFQPINREDVSVNERCSVCQNTKAEDEGKSWFAHSTSDSRTIRALDLDGRVERRASVPQPLAHLDLATRNNFPAVLPLNENRAQMTHHIHATCLRRMAFYQNQCSLCRTLIDRTSLPRPSLKELIGINLYNEPEAILGLVPALVMIGGVVALSTDFTIPMPMLLGPMFLGYASGSIVPAIWKNFDLPSSGLRIATTATIYSCSLAILCTSWNEGFGFVNSVISSVMVEIGGYVAYRLVPNAFRSVVERLLLNHDCLIDRAPGNRIYV